MDSELIALDIASGQRRWGYSVRNKVLGPSVVADGIVYTGDANDDTVRAINAVTGRELWKISTGGGAPTPVRPAVANGSVYVMGMNEKGTYLYGLNAANGEQQWKVSTGRMLSSEVIEVDGTVYLPLADSSDSSEVLLHALDAGNGRQRWKTPIGSTPDGTALAVANGVVYATGLEPNSSDATLYAIDGATGVERWTFPVDDAQLISSPTVDHGVAYFGTGSGDVYAITV